MHNMTASHGVNHRENIARCMEPGSNCHVIVSLLNLCTQHTTVSAR